MNRNMNMNLKAAWYYMIATLFCVLFGAVYEHFSFGVFSFSMVYAFAFPLLLGVLPNLVCAVYLTDRTLPVFSGRLWQAGIAALTVGSVFCGIIEIYGTTSGLAWVYFVTGAFLLGCGMLMKVLQSKAPESA